MLAVGVLAMCLASGASSAQPASTRAAASSGDDPDQAVRKKLHEPLPRGGIDATHLGEAIDQLRDKTGLIIIVDWRALEAVGVDRKTPLAIHLPEMQPATVLDVILTSAGIGHGKLGYTVHDGLVSISVTDDPARDVAVRRYDLSRCLGSLKGDARRKKLLAVTRLLTDHIDPDSWTVHGGTVGELNEHQGWLTVTQTVQNHERIAELLKDLTPP